MRDCREFVRKTSQYILRHGPGITQIFGTNTDTRRLYGTKKAVVLRSTVFSGVPIENTGLFIRGLKKNAICSVANYEGY
jgi:hypothetical protein